MVTGATQLVGIIGNPVAHSLSPAMHNAAFQSLGMDWLYVPLPVAPHNLAEAIRGLPALGFRAVNVTVPYKERVVPFLDKVSADASAIGAVNTITVRSDGSLTGENTDWAGFLCHLKEIGFDPSGCTAVILGSGGSARAVAYALVSNGAKVAVCSRNAETAGAIVERLTKPGLKGFIETWTLQRLQELDHDVDLIVNTTPLGMAPRIDYSPWPEGTSFPKCRMVYDLVYNPSRTRFMEQAHDAGVEATNGLGMLVHQAAIAFSLWTDKPAPLAVMKQAVALC
ncbi:MAG: shikimate dehydrogenase [Desulfomonilaceae bacterium]